MNDKKAKFILLAPAVLLLLALTVYPFIDSIRISLTSLNATRPHRTVFLGLGNYIRLFTGDALFLDAIANTFIVMVISIAAEIVIGFVVAHTFFKISHLRGAKLLRTMYALPMMITPVISGLLWSYILNPTLGIANYILSMAGIEPLPWFGNSSTALTSVILVNIWQWSPFMMLLILAGLTAIPQELYEAAAVDGAKWYHHVFLVELPLLKPVIILGTIFRATDNFRLFDLIYVTTSGGPGSATEVLSMFTYRQSFKFFNVGYGSASAVVILILSIIMAQFLIRFLKGASDNE